MPRILNVNYPRTKLFLYKYLYSGKRNQKRFQKKKKRLDVTNSVIFQKEQGKASQNQTKSREYKLIDTNALHSAKHNHNSLKIAKIGQIDNKLLQTKSHLENSFFVLKLQGC